MLPPGPLAVTPAPPPPLDVAGGAAATGIVAEQVLEALAALLHPDERQPEVGHGVADEVVRPVLGDVEQDRAAVRDRLQPARDEGRGQRRLALLDLDREHARCVR